ncbi:MAG TPA: extracellular solute-binding protein, partial [Symbiobacteriaceae bacterium]|nr:extracellular solute-binding protein [Symbiobacteriaceae bacterium]
MAGRKWLVWALLLALAATAGCRGTKEKRVPPPDGKVRIRFWHSLPEDGLPGQTLTTLVRQFNAQQQEVVVEAAFQGPYSTLEQKAIAAANEGQQPAVVMLADSSVHRIAGEKMLLALSDLVPAAAWQDFPGNLLESISPDRHYALPFNRAMAVLFYDKQLVAAPPRTWEEFRSAARRAAGKQTAGTAIYPDVHALAPFFHQAGGRWQYESGDPGFAGPQGKQALSFLQALVRDGSVVLVKPREYASDYLVEGRAAMVVMTSAAYPYVQAHGKGRMAMAPLPAGPAGAWTAGSGANLAVMRTGDRKIDRAAIQFVLYMTGKEATLQFAMAKTGYGPVRLSAVQDLR